MLLLLDKENNLFEMQNDYQVSEELAEFMKKKGYTFEERYIRVVLNWRRSGDERGLSELRRQKYNYEMLNFLIEDLSPWLKDDYDLSTLEVNR